MSSTRIQTAANVLCIAFLALVVCSVAKDLVFVLGHPEMHPTEANDLGAFYRSRQGYLFTSATLLVLAIAGIGVPLATRGWRWSSLTRWTISATLFLFVSVWGLNASFWVHGLH